MQPDKPIRRVLKRIGLILFCLAACAYYFVSVAWIPLYLMEGCKGAKRGKALDAARSSAPYLADFVRLFPDAEVTMMYFSGDDEPGFIASVDLYERYDFRMFLPAHFDPSRRKVIGWGTAEFQINEVSSAMRNFTGIAQVEYDPHGSRTFYASSWKKIVENGGDFGAIGYTMLTNQPVRGFKNRKTYKPE